MTAQQDAFATVLTEHLQPLFDEFLTLEIWARICVAHMDGDDEVIRDMLAEQLPGFDVDWATAEDDAADGWTPKCCIKLNSEIKGHDLRIEVHLTKSTITRITFGNDVLPKAISKVDMVKEFERKQLLSAPSK